MQIVTLKYWGTVSHASLVLLFFLFETKLAWDLSLLDIVNEEELYMYYTFSFQKKFDSLDFLKLIFTVTVLLFS